MLLFPESENSILAFKHLSPGTRLIIGIAQEMKDTVDQQKPHFAPERVTHLSGLYRRLMHIDREIAL